jgi:hypothetical protein
MAGGGGRSEEKRPARPRQAVTSVVNGQPISFLPWKRWLRMVGLAAPLHSAAGRGIPRASCDVRLDRSPADWGSSSWLGDRMPDVSRCSSGPIRSPSVKATAGRKGDALHVSARLVGLVADGGNALVAGFRFISHTELPVSACASVRPEGSMVVMSGARRTCSIRCRFGCAKYLTPDHLEQGMCWRLPYSVEGFGRGS